MLQMGDDVDGFFFIIFGPLSVLYLWVYLTKKIWDLFRGMDNWEEDLLDEQDRVEQLDIDDE